MKFTDEERRAWLANLDKRFSSAAVLIENEQGKPWSSRLAIKTIGRCLVALLFGESPLEAAVRE